MKTTNLFIANSKIGYLTVLSVHQANESKRHKKFAKCICVCGKIIERDLWYLCQDFQHSCGCQRYNRPTGNKSKGFKGCGDIGVCYIQGLRFSANTRKIYFDITIEQIWELFLKQNRKCALTNEDLCFNSQKQREKGLEQTASLDRIDSSKGYTIDNIQWVHKDVNYMKGKMNDSELISICHKIHSYQANKPDLSNVLCDTSIHQYFHPQNWKGVGEIGLNYFTNIKENAIERNLPFEITLDDMWNLFLEQKRMCAITGELLYFGNFRSKQQTGLVQTASLDRIDSNKGYVLGNIQWIHKTINWIKHDMPQARFLELCSKLANHYSHEAIAA